MSVPEQENPGQQPSRLVSQFEDLPVEDHGSGWTDLWVSDDSDLWDRGKPSPALVDIIEQRPDLFHPWTADGRRKKALVPGCGKGYDVVMLALHGFDVYGLEIAATGVTVANEYASAELKSPQGCNFAGDILNEGSMLDRDRGQAKFVEGDFFDSDWESEAATSANTEKFDLVYDYTFLCALHPSMRRNWATRMGELLHTGGLLVCLEFPMYKDPALPGPPWGVKGVHWDLLVRGGDGISNIDEQAEPVAEAHAGQFERTLYTNPARSYEVAKGTDMLSIYVRK